MKRWAMVRLPLPMVMAGVLAALLAKVMLALPPPEILALIGAMLLVLELENKGERVSTWLLEWLVLWMLLLLFLRRIMTS